MRVAREPTWVFAVRHAGRIAESIFALAETWPISTVSPGVGLVGTELHTACDEVPKNRLDASQEQQLVRVTHARRSTEVNSIRNEARAEDGVIPRLVVWESNNIVGNPCKSRLSLDDGSQCSCVGEESRHLGSASITVEALEDRGNDKRTVRSRSC
jgi:hypothetical protein